MNIFYRLVFEQEKKEVTASLLDYVLNPDQFKYNQIPILFVYAYDRPAATPQVTNLKINFKVSK